MWVTLGHRADTSTALSIGYSHYEHISMVTNRCWVIAKGLKGQFLSHSENKRPAFVNTDLIICEILCVIQRVITNVLPSPKDMLLYYFHIFSYSTVICINMCGWKRKLPLSLCHVYFVTQTDTGSQVLHVPLTNATHLMYS